jgi:uncharacterized protein with von Willebrand factor type A (vWA) domain
MMTPELLKSYQQHAQTLFDLSNEIKTIAEDCDVEQLLGTIRGGLTDIVRAVEPGNNLAIGKADAQARIAMIGDAVNIDCNIDQSEFLGNVAAAIFDSINNQLKTN